MGEVNVGRSAESSARAAAKRPPDMSPYRTPQLGSEVSWASAIELRGRPRRQALWKLSSVVVPCLSDERPRERTCLLPDLGHMLSPRTRKTGPHRVRCVGPVRALDGSGNSHVDSAISKVIKEKHAWGYPVLAIE